MSARSLSGVLIFALGFGCASLATAGTASEDREETGVLEDGLSYVNIENEVKLVNAGKDVYLVMIERSPGISPADTPVSFREGALKVSRYGLARLVAYRLEPIAVLADQFWRSCAMGDCSFIGPLPPPPPPTAPPDPSAVFLQPQLQ
ncbi:MAG TPA: hypothetical protein VKM72_10440 [Thermoanaerobaculia bacterium]|nr:hypothetical protein [Thermoanaerobaculia bacterium]